MILGVRVLPDLSNKKMGLHTPHMAFNPLKIGQEQIISSLMIRQDKRRDNIDQEKQTVTPFVSIQTRSLHHTIPLRTFLSLFSPLYCN
ncbi:hypothetical protein Scep_029850 [Stephania cephalantha]|uniref:Uncharacterized protein n=1 Tax=Stephania cephalantha TaxID=152367 RepID=A0AAP0E659_9MAGN